MSKQLDLFGNEYELKEEKTEKNTTGVRGTSRIEKRKDGNGREYSVFIDSTGKELQGAECFDEDDFEIIKNMRFDDDKGDWDDKEDEEDD